MEEQSEARKRWRELLSGSVRLHVLHHAAEGDLYGNWMIEELARHDYTISPGALATPHLPTTPCGVGMAREKVRELVREAAP